MPETPPGQAPWIRLDTRTRGAREVIRSEVEVKLWMEAMPSTDAVRPARCPACGAAGRPLRRGLVTGVSVGHVESALRRRNIAKSVKSTEGLSGRSSPQPEPVPLK